MIQDNESTAFMRVFSNQSFILLRVSPAIIAYQS